jgi:cytochrome c
MKVVASIAAVMLAGGALIADAADDAAAEGLVKKSGCLNCHSIDKQKDGPSYKSVAAKYKGKADAEQKLVTHLTTSPKVKIDGKDQVHPTLKTTNEADVKNVAQWVLSR